MLLRALRALPSAVAAMPRRGDGRELKLGAGGEVEGEAGEAGAARAKYRAWGHEHVTTSLLENAVILETIKKEGTLLWRPP